jgi:Protein of unknown function (DUF751)
VDDFFKAVSKYPFFLASVILGVFFDAWNTRVKPLLANPLSATFVIIALGLSGVGLVFTLRAMLRLG